MTTAGSQAPGTLVGSSWLEGPGFWMTAAVGSASGRHDHSASGHHSAAHCATGLGRCPHHLQRRAAANLVSAGEEPGLSSGWPTAPSARACWQRHRRRLGPQGRRNTPPHSSRGWSCCNHRRCSQLPAARMCTHLRLSRGWSCCNPHRCSRAAQRLSSRWNIRCRLAARRDYCSSTQPCGRGQPVPLIGSPGPRTA
jgi:hypothetical protein